MYRFLLTKRWLGYLALTAFFATVCVSLGMWQMERRNEVVANITRINSNYSADPVELSQARPWLESFDRNREWTPIKLTGEYLTEDQRVVRNRPSNGQPGYEVVVPFRLTTGEIVIIDRGWLPIGERESGRPDVVPQPASGQITLLGRLRSSEPVLQRGAPEGQIASINLPAYEQELGYPIFTGSYLQMAEEQPAATQNPEPFAKPSVNEGANLSYSMQWYAFGVLFFVGFGYIARQQARINREDAELDILGGPDSAAGPGGPDDDADLGHSPAARAAAAARRTAQRRHHRPGSKPTSEDEEDALLDAQGYTSGTSVVQPERRRNSNVT
ncbi:SURF1 family protein [Acaricomes phytoseiuli]|uniref:SURF1 family cytochrome oxidase biogenesis protein n=1 Tax=Acaricomes phytoseiuli TaxID=291968 RepID=UPI000361F264|nr:SURF1 family protein [Acaricomes phytoseiuli]MCW1250265.1 SURF1 family protein [Acaricomes phytoseiuli]